jgi:hypothetical protein
MSHEKNTNRQAAPEHRDDVRKPWVAPQVREAFLKDAEYGSNPGIDGLGQAFTAS